MKNSPTRSRSSAEAPLSLRARVWVERNGAVAMTEAGADLLEQIDAVGSLSEAARRLRFGYRRAWMLLDAMNRCWSGRVAITQVGGRAGGGARLTNLGRNVLRAYRDLQLQMEQLIGREQPAFVRAARSGG